MKSSSRVHFWLCGIITSFIAIFCVGRYCAYGVNEEKANADIAIDDVTLSDNYYHTTIRLQNYNVDSGEIIVRLKDEKGNTKDTVSYVPSEEIDLDIEFSYDLEAADIVWLNNEGMQICEPQTLVFNVIYAMDWKDLSDALTLMNRRFQKYVLVENDSCEYESGRLIIKVKDSLPELSGFNVAMMVIDDQNHYFLQFDNTSDAKKCAEFLEHQPGIEYVDIDSDMAAS